MLTKAQLCWSGHIVRMLEERLPKRLLYGELQGGKRSVGGQRKRYKDTLKVALNKFQIDPDTWEDTAANRSEWRSRVAEGTVDYEDCLTRAENKRRIRKTFSVSSSSTQSHICTICGKSFWAAIELFSHKRTHHTVAVPISPPTRDPWGKYRGHHPIGWTNERTNEQELAGDKLMKICRLGCWLHFVCQESNCYQREPDIKSVKRQSCCLPAV